MFTKEFKPIKLLLGNMVVLKITVFFVLLLIFKRGRVTSLYRRVRVFMSDSRVIGSERSY